MDRSDLAKRMKGYEFVSKTKLVPRMPVIIRIDGKAFHTFTRGFKKPFDEVLIKSMQDTMKHLCENIHGCVLGYTQSDEITLVLVDYRKLNTCPWFDNEVQKICSISASMATMAFNKFFRNNVGNFVQDCATDYETQGLCGEGTIEYELCKTYENALDKGAMFDARCFNIPKEEVANNIYWRQLDATRNSIQIVGQANFSQKELHKKSCNKIQDMLFTQKGINWNDYPIYLKRGSCCIRERHFEECENGTEMQWSEDYPEGGVREGVWRNTWSIDKNIPIFKGEDRDYIDKLVYVGE